MIVGETGYDDYINYSVREYEKSRDFQVEKVRGGTLRQHLFTCA